MLKPSLYITLTILMLLFWERTKGLPNLNETSQEPILIFSGEEAYIDCKVENQQNYTVLFKFLNPDQNSQNSEVISAGNIRITSDTRFSVLHHSEHEVWVLKIQNSKTSDSGIYICETNSSPKQQIARLLSVIEPNSSETNGKSGTLFSDINHNYTDCCINEGVPDLCHTFCHMTGLINNQIPHQTVQSCLEHLPSITKCLNSGRNNLGCCQRQNIPSTCLSVCVGNFSLSTVTEHYTCMSYAAPMLACIAEGIETLPEQPLDITVEPISTTELKMQWFTPNNSRGGKTESYQINVTQLHTFDGIEDNKKINNLSIKDKSRPSLYGLQFSFQINATLNEYIIKDLKPFTMYEIIMTSVNKFGSSLPSEALRTLTLSPESDSQKIPPNNSKFEPKLPNIRKCCEKNGVVLDRCLNTLCDPTKADTASLSDLMICAPWANVTFKCMSLETDENGWTDHSNCCQQRGVSSVCMPLCQGSVKRIDFRHFVCLDHMSDYSSCILEHHKVLTSEPQAFRVSNVHHDWAVLEWKPPKKLANTVLKYYIHWRETSIDSPNIYQIEESFRSPYLIDHLKPGFRYEVFVSAVNKYGVSQGSARVLFSTPQISKPEEIEIEGTNLGYNETACCLRASLPNKCLPLCSYKVKVADVFNLSSSCVNSLSTLVRCGTGGRNHVPCCRRRDVSDACLNVCAGLVDSSSFVIATRCSQDFGKIIQCMEEGTGLLPGMPIGLHTNFITTDTVHIQWKPALEDSEATHITYQVRYGKTDNLIPLHPLEHTNSINATETKAVIKGLESNTHYSIYVTAHNLYGVSLPSLILLIKTLDLSERNRSNIVHSKLGPPHSVELIHQTVDSVTFKWLPPLYVSSDTTISYIVYYKAINGTAALMTNPTKDNWFSVYTPYTTMYLTNLTYNSEYALAIQAITDKNETSSSSEIVLAWTDPAIPAAVQMPIIIPAGAIIEGSNITVMCVAMGTPVPVISMFINGQLVTKGSSRHLAFSITNVNRNLTSISCYAVNGAGKDAQSAQSSLDVFIKFKPSAIGLPQITSAPLEGTARLICQVSANPPPKLLWFRQQNADIVQLQATDNINFITVPHAEMTSTWIYTLLIKRTSKSDTGNYMCSAENEFGKSVITLTLEITPKDVILRNTSNCCLEQGVSEECLSVCTLDIDIESALSRPECFGELDKLMNCAADGSDHRQCCRRRQVPNGCLRWCAGLKVNIPSLCILSSARDIISCFQEGKALLPGPPTNVHVQQFIDDNTVMVEWTPPDKNSELVQWYRVFWRPVGSRDLMRNQTDKSWFELQNLEPDKMYEFVVKSGNHYGLSVFTDPLVVTIRGSQSHSTSLGNKLLKVVLGISIGVVLVIVGIAAIIYYYKFHYIVKNPQTRGVSFENPTYLKDSGTIQIHDSRVSAYVSDSAQSNADKTESQE